MILAGVSADEIGHFIENQFSSDSPDSQEFLDIAVDNLTDPETSSLSEFWESVKNNISDGVEYVSNIAENVKNNIESISLPEYEGLSEEFLDDEPQPENDPPLVNTDLTGQAAEQDGSIYQVDGSVSTDGEFNVSGTTSEGDKSIQIDGELNDGKVTGEFSTDNNSGIVDGNEENIAECQTAQRSGGQGTFSNSHIVGSGTGEITFDYEAYDIPDAFTVSTKNGTIFTTDGLVSGSKTVSLPLDEEPIVFVSVTAPQDGTEWEYSIGCTD